MDIRGRDSGFSMTHFLVEQLRTTDPGLTRWTETVQTVKKCENVSVKAVAAESEGQLQIDEEKTYKRTIWTKT